jgi:hypothetical protein
MNRATPPKFSTRLLQRFAISQRRESMAGDLLEQYAEGRSAMWYRRQVLTTIAVAMWADLRGHKLVAAQAIVLWLFATFTVSTLTGSVQQALHPYFLSREWPSEFWMRFWLWYDVPFVLVRCIEFMAIGWLIAKFARRHRITMGLICAVAQGLLAAPWGFHVWNLLQAGLMPFWDIRLALIFQAICLFAGYPLCLLLGGSWAESSDRPDLVVS